MIPLGVLAGSQIAAGPLPAVYDTFTRADSSTAMGTAPTGQTWSSVIGTWGISSNRAYPVTASGTGTAAINSGLNPSTTALQVSARIYGLGTSRYPVIFLGAASGANHQAAFRAYLDGDLTQVTLQDALTYWASVTGLTLVGGEMFTLRSVPNGANCDLTLFINGVSLATLTRPARTGTWCGIGTGNTPDTACSFDDFTVEAL